MPASGTDKARLRRQLRSQRRALSPQQQWQAANNLLNVLRRQPVIQRAQRLAFYWANDGELDPEATLVWAQQHNKKCFLPALKSRATLELLFLPLHAATRLKANRFGIPEPDVPWYRAIRVWQLDVMLLPLVGFDRHGGRLGMGGGFYDKTLAGIARHPRRPLLIGIGHSCQEVDSLPLEDWDIPLDAVITDKNVLFVRDKYRYKFRK